MAHLIFTSLAAFSLLNANLTANDNISQEITIEEHVPVGSREIDPETREKMKSSRAQQREEEERDAPAASEMMPIRKVARKLAAASSPFKLAPSRVEKPNFSLAAYPYPVNCHWLVSVADTGRSLEIEDGSHWEVSASDAYTLRRWARQDNLVITPNYSWFSSYDYYITDRNTNTYVQANLAVGPLAFGPYSHWIVDIDYFGGHVYLENQMVWCIDPKDSYVLKDWSANDHIILGVNDSWFSSYDHILINVIMDDHIRVKQY